MAIGEIALLCAAALILLVRIVVAWRRDARGSAAPTYPEPRLKLDAAGDQAHELFGELGATLDADREGDRRYLADDTTDPPLDRRLPVSRKMLLTGGCLIAFVALPYAHPKLAPFRLLAARSGESASDYTPAATPMPSASVGEGKLPGETYDQQDRAKDLEAPAPDARGPIAHGGRTEAPAELAPAVSENKPPRSIDDPSGHALDGFFAKLARTETKQPGAVARILYYGDSIVASDFITGKLRRMMQSRFGDAGHGYALIANAWPGWFHIDVSRKASAEWRVSTCVGPYAADGIYGLGCASFVSHHAGVWSRFGTARGDKWGRAVSRFELEYLEQPGGGEIDLRVDDKPQARLATEGEHPRLRWRALQVDDGAHELELRAADDRPVRVFGVRMERDVPGVTVSALGVTGARARFLDKQDDAVWAEALRAAKPDLVCLAFGSNEITDGSMYPIEDYRRTLGNVMHQLDKALPASSFMLVAPPDMASNNAAWGHSRPMVHSIVEAQRALAGEHRWAFWDQFRAMGGSGSMWAWIKGGLGNEDMFHPTGRGGNLLGTWQYLALMEAFEKYKAAHR